MFLNYGQLVSIAVLKALTFAGEVSHVIKYYPFLFVLLLLVQPVHYFESSNVRFGSQFCFVLRAERRLQIKQCFNQNYLQNDFLKFYG